MQRHDEEQQRQGPQSHSAPPAVATSQWEEVPPGWHPPMAPGATLEQRSSLGSQAARLWSSVSVGAVTTGGVVAESAAAAWGNVKGWTAHRLGRKAGRTEERDAMLSYDDEDVFTSLEDSLDGEDAKIEKQARQRWQGRNRNAQQETALYQVPKDLPLEDIAKEMQDSWRLKENEVERLLESAVAKSERPWLILLSALATLIVALLVLLGLRLEGQI